MNIIGTCLERCDENTYFKQFKEKCPNVAADEYEWKCWIIKKYFHDNIVVNLVKILIGVILLILSGTARSFLNGMGNKSVTSLLVIVFLFLGIIMVGTGIIFSISNRNCKKRYSEYLWDNDIEGEDNFPSKIIQFYNKR